MTAWPSVGEESDTDLKARTRRYALRIVRLYSALPKMTEAQVLGRQLLRCGTSVGAHYREACRAKSDADFVSKIEGALQELEESLYWMELIVGAGLMAEARLQSLYQEGHELTAILVTVVRKVKRRRRMRAQPSSRQLQASVADSNVSSPPARDASPAQRQRSDGARD
ncbi:MAG: four helix bundle protein [Chloroflexi bacterium]|nr:four helix bundle protein [Chloroflexota bacterium]